MGMKDRFWYLLLLTVKRWTRAKLLPKVTSTISEIEIKDIVISVGGFGPVDRYLSSLSSREHFRLISFDIDPKHKPKILADVENLNSELIQRRIKPNVIIALEVFEHVPNPFTAINECFDSLSSGGVLIFSTPWIIPVHDAPQDFWRFTPEALRKLTQKFGQVEIIARGDEFDSVIALMLRGLFGKGLRFRFMLTLGLIFSIISPKPKLYFEPRLPDSTIGYIVIAKK
jgi:SAM-dependent methyltransferase